MKQFGYFALAILICSIIAASWHLRGTTSQLIPGSLSPIPPEQVLKHYIAAVYARDYATAYKWVSTEDRKIKSRTEYLSENPSFSGPALRSIEGLAAKIEFTNLHTKIIGDRATLQFKIKLPDANNPLLQKIFLNFDLDRLANLSDEERRTIDKQIRSISQKGKLPMLEGEEKWQLLKEPNGWRVYLNWSSATIILFEARIMDGLQWEFEPVRSYVAARPGETIHALYRVKNVSSQTITAKARHLEEPKELAAKYFEIVQCFCFIQQTLAPGEEKKLPLIFRIHWDTPDEVREFRVTYEFYPLERFPAS